MSTALTPPIDSLDTYLSLVFGQKYSVLRSRVDRWSLKAAPLNPDKYPKGNTITLERWNIPAYQYPYLLESEEACYATRHRLLSHLVVIVGKDSMLFDQNLFEEVKQTYELGDQVVCAQSGDVINVEDINIAIRQTSRLGTLELNVDFTDLVEPNAKLDIGTLAWVKPAHHLFSLRSLFRQFDGLLPKVQTKAYLTDRRQTGTFPSNREARWEIDPSSPQFATKSECINIEVKLLAQILEFTGAPTREIDKSAEEKIVDLIGSSPKPGSFRCPISGQSIDYSKFISEANEPNHGRSTYQVGHLVPLARPEGKHAAANISWITELGNRVQGEDSLTEIVEQIFRMANYHRNRLNLDWNQIEQIYSE